jgi:hypothetical protein
MSERELRVQKIELVIVLVVFAGWIAYKVFW